MKNLKFHKHKMQKVTSNNLVKTNSMLEYRKHSMSLRLLGPWPVDLLMLVALQSTSTDCYNNRAYWQQFLYVNQLSQNSMAAPECLVCNSGPEIAHCKLQQKPYISHKIWKKKKWIKIQNAAKDYKLIWPTTFDSQMVEKKRGRRFTCWIWVLPIHDISSIIAQSLRSAQKQSVHTYRIESPYLLLAL
jgi:hypothetical protein